MRRIITIDREFGSGGREIGKRLAETMNIAYYDHEIVEKISESSEFTKEYIDSLDEKRPIPIFPINIASTFGMQMNFQMDRQIDLYSKTADLIRNIASKSDCLIVGRCADHILRDMNPLKLFIYADFDYKIKRCKEKKYEDIKNLSDKEIEKKIISVDKERKSYYNFYTNQEWGDRLNYDLLVNTTNVDVKCITKVLKGYIDEAFS